MRPPATQPSAIAPRDASALTRIAHSLRERPEGSWIDAARCALVSTWFAYGVRTSGRTEAAVR